MPTAYAIKRNISAAAIKAQAISAFIKISLLVETPPFREDNLVGEV
ncbi:Uncharacterised protein [Brevundimonas vesicularis]|uniref:Uncharacterized protein n=1 Tax=Brevundimonas vesicularis TaxID=41276 RepID=A0A2X1BUN5_BREVE|nr:Uncharacterised protein [Brevundimonas vesicularis]